MSQTKNIPAAVICLYDQSKGQASDTEVFESAKLAKDTYKSVMNRAMLLESQLGFNQSANCGVLIGLVE